MKRFSAGITIVIQHLPYGVARPQCSTMAELIPKIQLEAVAVSGNSSSIQKIGVRSWVDAGVWLDFILVGMVAGSAIGLAYTFLAH